MLTGEQTLRTVSRDIFRCHALTIRGWLLKIKLQRTSKRSPWLKTTFNNCLETSNWNVVGLMMDITKCALKSEWTALRPKCIIYLPRGCWPLHSKSMWTSYACRMPADKVMNCNTVTLVAKHLNHWENMAETVVKSKGTAAIGSGHIGIVTCEEWSQFRRWHQDVRSTISTHPRHSPSTKLYNLSQAPEVPVK